MKRLVPWFILTLLGFIQSAYLLRMYTDDVRYLHKYQLNGVRRALAYSAWRNELGRLSIFTLFHILGIEASRRADNNEANTPRFVAFLFFAVTAFKVYGSYRDAQLRLTLIEHGN